MSILPIVAIVGRPNVGKSTFFNRIAGERIAVVSDTPGVTRDRVSADAEWNGRRFIAVDTGGITDGKGIVLWDAIQEQTAVALEQADMVIQVVDVQSGLVADDIAAANLVRRYSKPTVVAANKADNRLLGLGADEFHQLGFSDVISVSALHGQGFDDVLRTLLGGLPAYQHGVKSDADISVAIVGRPNVGKSALFNQIVSSERSIVSPIAGTTHDAIDINIRYGAHEFRFIDTAGIRRRGKVAGGVEKYSVLRAVAAIERASICVVVLSAEEFVTAQDTHIAGLVSDAVRGSVLVLNKWDLASELKLNTETVTSKLVSEFKFLPASPIVLTSATRGSGINGLMDAIVKTHGEYHKLVDDAELNACIAYAVGENEPPARRGARPRIRRAKQEHHAPPVVVFDTTHGERIHFSYRRYLEGRLRKQFGFNGVPIVMRFRNIRR